MPEFHAKLSPSAAHRWIPCPRSVALYALLPKKPAGEYAAIGTVAHGIAESALKYYNRTGSLEYMQTLCEKVAKKPLVMEQDGYKVTIDGNMLANVGLYVDHVILTMQKLDGEYELNVEKRFDLSWLVPNMFGTNDSSLVPLKPHGVLYIFDYKNGRTQVDATDNVQMMIYALGALGDGNPTRTDKVVMTIFQPNCFTRSGALYDEFSMDAKDLYMWAFDVLVPAAKATEDPDAPCKTGDWCAFCDASGICPAKKTEALSLFQDVEAGTPKLPSIDSLPPEDVAKMSKFFNSKEFKAWTAALAATEFDMLSRGIKIPGRHLEEKEVKGDREWSMNETELSERFPLLDIYEHKLRSPASIEREMKTLKVLDKAALDALMRETTQRPVSTKTIVVDGEEADNKSNILNLF